MIIAGAKHRLDVKPSTIIEGERPVPRHRVECDPDTHVDMVCRVGPLLAWQCRVCGRIDVA